jgi:hypothetical protein
MTLSLLKRDSGRVPTIIDGKHMKNRGLPLIIYLVSYPSYE